MDKLSQNGDMKVLSDEKILKLWHDPKFEGSYVGARRLQVLLKTNFDVDVSQNRLYKILKQDSIYLIHKRPQRKIVRRTYDLRYYGEIVQIDLAHMFEYNSFKYFLCAVDLFSSKVYTAPLKSKKSSEVEKALQSVLKLFGVPITKIESDRGSEFGLEVKKFLQREKIVARFKFHPNKASAVENYIGIIKRRLYTTLRGNLSKDWVSALKLITNHMNDTPLKRLGWLKPNEINSMVDSVKVLHAKRENGIPIFREPELSDQIKNQESYENSTKNIFQKNAYCYLDFDEKLFDKSYDVSVSYILLHTALSKSSIVYQCELI